MAARTLSAAIALLACAGPFACATQSTMYRWGGYDQTLYDHYKNPQSRDEFVARLSGIIEAAEKSGQVVPPGCYAEYGWALYEGGRTAEAVVYFEKEKKQWPESSALMDKLIRNANRANPAAHAAVPASAAEENK
ncbi:MAG: DUF4810 domain-containing protein [Myxococcales bacterium]